MVLNGLYKMNTPLWYEGDCFPTIMVEESLLDEERSDISDVEEETDEMCLCESDRDD